tara:strand:+ start:4577 stop:4795 length:219 start_codon:yes stop_codon:yes gene_type:complete
MTAELLKNKQKEITKVIIENKKISNIINSKIFKITIILYLNIRGKAKKNALIKYSNKEYFKKALMTVFIFIN